MIRHPGWIVRIGVEMRAVGITAPGGLDTLEIIERPVREPGPGEVRIAVRAAAVNPTDIGLRERGADLPAPWTPGMDAAGVIERVGPEVERLSVGDAVMAAVSPRRPEGGAQAELLVAPAASVVPIPTGATFAQASTLPMNGLTALRGLELLGFEDGATLVVTGGAGLLGSYVIGLAKHRGLRVIADAKPEDEPLVRGFGADVTVPRGADFVPGVRDAAPAGADGVFDTAMLHDAAFGALRDGGGMVVVRGWKPPQTERGIVVHPVMVAEVLERTAWLEELRALASDGRLPLRVATTMPLDRVAEAQQLMDGGGLRGRVVLELGGGEPGEGLS
jgi:NADPH:quinone reductase-like Zn-dependent oxidoreductase